MDLDALHLSHFKFIHTSIAPDLLIIKVCVSSHLRTAREEGVGQGAALPVKRVPVIVKQAVKRHPDVSSSRRPSAVCRHVTEIQRGDVAPSFEGRPQDVIHQNVGQVG